MEGHRSALQGGVKTMNIEYRDTSTRYPRLVRSVEARLGAFTASGRNKTEAKAALLAAIEAQGEHLYARRYLVGPRATFCLHYAQGWCYDIAAPSKNERLASSVTDTLIHFSTTFLGDDLTEKDAAERMRRHFDQYHEGSEEAA